MGEWFRKVIGRLLDGLIVLLTWAWDFVASVWADLKEAFWQAWSSVYFWVFEQLPAEWSEQINAIDWTYWISYLDDISWIIPVWEMLGIVVTTMTVVSVIRIARWVLGLIPTIGG